MPLDLKQANSISKQRVLEQKANWIMQFGPCDGAINSQFLKYQSASYLEKITDSKYRRVLSLAQLNALPRAVGRGSTRKSSCHAMVSI